ncbi:10-formyltetrahydrofolate:L-methionyl-tRNA(fMet) N-formyltransferase [Candidatus Terasakiella magnetica]|uniref:Methionyl-tRNA formyltransferase n=1 Tax=Candidatus Terasakiella magnetica TaxID=1867952 RepID=A0A1C3REH7_9PROT|nr:methionyl-tRNA formyltransferase [Candidatus Terasakiella magnetica]SCA55642.1 10-formyltetrahydrofolate:L-methionyl-tRNA(fMet) N-formyltransferase [Candidatus Terasakiella magnetica]
MSEEEFQKVEKPMRLIFMGTPDFSVPILAALIDAGHEVVCVYSQPPRKSGRGQKVNLTPVHAYAESQGIEVRTPLNLKSEEDRQAFADLNADCAIVAAYGLILPKVILDAPKYGCLNAHASILPRWRGAAPIQRAIEAGDDVSGVTIMQMDVGLDTGDMLLVQPVPITPETTGESLHDSLSMESAQLTLEALRAVEGGFAKPQAQPEEGVTYAKKLEKGESQIDWSQNALEIDRKIRAFTPWPGTWFAKGKDRIKVIEAEIVDMDGEAGTRLDTHGLVIACAKGALKLTRVQRSGKGATDAESFLRGFDIALGEKLD